MRHFHCGDARHQQFREAIHAMRSGFLGGPFGGGPRGRGERRRMFEGGELRLVLLKLIEEQPRHGYDLIREIESRTGGAYAPSPGVVYPTMTLLIDMGLADEQQSDGPRKLLAITEAGRQHLVERADEVHTAMARLAALAKVTERTDAAPVRRAMQNLKTALHERLSQDGVTRDIQLEVARILDEAVGKIERL
ncbi:PadR family transcriptional regulator [Ciceribacter sp. L1K23]|uniref:PadR family transcriptional regulator n=1 Tax=Ciceribacter sp. L1K23 TaxID=2820276 RepID=UPI001B81C977|nr:PadR family transcriptional regulator [Ciceribacter sp. L1K23]MBR0556266.1 PadR family transcriptional regulator [Ciceribacter sp. L1K23]